MLNDLVRGVAKLLAFSTRNGQLNGGFFRILENLPRLCASLIEGIFLQGLLGVVVIIFSLVLLPAESTSEDATSVGCISFGWRLIVVDTTLPYLK